MQSYLFSVFTSFVFESLTKCKTEKPFFSEMSGQKSGLSIYALDFSIKNREIGPWSLSLIAELTILMPAKEICQ